MDYCLLNNINPNNITLINLKNNQLTDISGIKIFKNLEHLVLYKNNLNKISEIKIFKNLKYLYIGYNQIKDISVIKSLNNIKELNIEDLELESDQIEYIQSLKNLKLLFCKNGFKDMKVLNKLNNIEIYE